MKVVPRSRHRKQGTVEKFPEGGKDLKGTVCFKCDETILKGFRDTLDVCPLRDKLDRALRITANGVCFISAEDALMMPQLMSDLIIYDQTG